ncbi:Ig-like domain-containing protein [Aurantibacter crassamenti]|uniref:Ig-like domain-containing protein n=1 Tax=Aurantibacter crassamenti TaxID=1837375 RepID=UPI00193A798B|nr:Ig-like domain-containing protein [Aurantibacter crassamenti]MBM1104887.1 Ig-like domain-containing protein [Aurantibacter crassamenti]
MIRRLIGCLFLFLIVAALVQCARRGSPTGGPKDLDPPILVKAEPPNMTIEFKAKRIRLYFDEYITLKDIQEQLIVSPPLKYTPEISPQGGASKFVEIKIKDTLRENTTYTLNFGQSIVDHNEGNPSSFLNYVFSTGTYIDSLSVSGVVKDAFKRKADEFLSVMLYEIDTAYNDSTIFKKAPNYITNTLDSTVIFTLNNLKAGNYKIFALKDAAKNNIFDQNADKIAFLQDTVSLPTDSTYLLSLFKEIQNYSIQVPSFEARNKISFGYYGLEDDFRVEPLTQLPDSVRYKFLKHREKDTLNFWFTPTELDSIVFLAINDKLSLIDTFTVKKRKVGIDSLQLNPNQSGGLDFNKDFSISLNTPISKIDSTKFKMIDKDSINVSFNVMIDSIENEIDFDFEKEPNQNYNLSLLPGAVVDFFEETNDTINYNLSTNSLADYGNLRLNIQVDTAAYPLVVQLTDQQGALKQEIYATKPKVIEFNNIEPSKYFLRVIFDVNGNKIWDTGSILKSLQPERVSHYPDTLEIRANWEVEETFIIND